MTLKTNFKYLVVGYRELNDQWECDADREPLLCITDDSGLLPYKTADYEIYEINEDGTLTGIQVYDW